MCQWTLLLWAAECESPDASCSDQRRIRERRASADRSAGPDLQLVTSYAGKEGLRREERGESRGIVDKNESVAQNRSGRAVQLCNEMDRRFFTYVRHSVLPRHSYDLGS